MRTHATTCNLIFCRFRKVPNAVQSLVPYKNIENGSLPIGVLFLPSVIIQTPLRSSSKHVCISDWYMCIGQS